MNSEEAQKLIKAGETHTVEFKKSLSLMDEIGEAVSEFSNADGGIIFVDIGDDKEVIGVQIGKKTIEDLANYIKQHTDNQVFPKISVADIEGKSVIAIEVEESSEKPVFFKRKAYIRVGKSKHQLSASEIRKLAKESGEKVYWDERICEKADLKDIDWDFVKDFFIPKYESAIKKKVAGSDKDLLEALDCIKDNKPTNAGILLFGKNLQGLFRNSYVALARYKGHKEGAERLDYKEFTGNLIKQIDNCDEYVKEHISTMSRLHPYKAEREDIPEYSLFSIRELIVNAVCHRDYSEERTKVIIKMFEDRVEFYNPGGLPEEITPENIAKKQFSRNPAIAKVLSKIGYIEEMGEGWDKILEEHKNHPLKPEMPKIDADRYTMIVTLFSTKQKFEQEKAVELNERQRQAVEYVRKHGKITNKEYRQITGLSDEGARKDISELLEKKIFQSKGRGRSTHYIMNSR